ncbi:unnamed protein product [Caenorhabditis angaria]|uniref:Helix-turn-helix domain-containing protein n=1 Tax=Caenorhabditis angaria TaxID=860376 RepID=A0A9P1J550_9PELO|nr:unnamed protein product [Caenorhabditis angaria]
MNLLVRMDSFHPIKQKSNIVCNTIRTAKLCSSPEYISHSTNMAKKVLEKNGYYFSNEKTKRSFHKKRITVPSNMDRCIMPIPFLGDAITKQIRNLLNSLSLEAQVIELKGRSLGDILTKNRCFDNVCHHRDCFICRKLGIGKCNVKGVVYKITCDCGEIYIGETGRPLFERFAEHQRAAKNPLTKSYLNTTWSKHAVEKHGGTALTLDLKILEVERNTTRRKILEGVAIKHANPTLNTKEELSEMIAKLGTLELAV